MPSVKKRRDLHPNVRFTAAARSAQARPSAAAAACRRGCAGARGGRAPPACACAPARGAARSLPHAHVLLVVQQRLHAVEEARERQGRLLFQGLGRDELMEAVAQLVEVGGGLVDGVCRRCDDARLRGREEAAVAAIRRGRASCVVRGPFVGGHGRRVVVFHGIVRRRRGGCDGGAAVLENLHGLDELSRWHVRCYNCKQIKYAYFVRPHYFCLQIYLSVPPSTCRRNSPPRPTCPHRSPPAPKGA